MPKFIASALAAGLAGLLLATAAEAGPRWLIGVGLKRDQGEGVPVAQVERGSPAAEAALQPGDRILAVNDVEVVHPLEVSGAIQSRGEQVAVLYVKRGETAFYAPVRPQVWPDPERDAELFPYEPSTAPLTPLKATIAGRDYPVVEAGRVFNWMQALGVDAPRGRIAFRAKIARCSDLASLDALVSQPNAEALFPVASVRSALFDFDVARDEQAACEAYMEKNELSLSSPRVVIAGRFVYDGAGRVSDGGMVLMVDAALFDHGHVTLGEQLWSAFQRLESAGLFSE